MTVISGSNARGVRHRLVPAVAVRLLLVALLPGSSSAGAIPTTGARQEPGTAIVELNVVVVLYAATFCKTLSPAEIERFHREVAEFQHFYEQSVGDRMRLALHFLRIDRVLGADEITQVSPDRYYLAREDIESELEAYGLNTPRVDEVIAFYAWDNVNREGAALAYGGGAVGPDGQFLGDAGYNSQGVFAWDPGRISQIAIHEVLHNIDDMFNRSGMGDAFLNADSMSRNMERMVRERPGYFLPEFDDAYMLRWAGRELRGEEGYPWHLQLKYYGWMLDRTPAEDWLRLDYGERTSSGPPPRLEPLYREAAYPTRTDRVFLLVRATYAPAGEADLPEAVGLVGRRNLTGVLALEPDESAHTGFDGREIFRIPLWSAWLPLEGRDPAAGSIRLAVDPTVPGRPAADIEIDRLDPAPFGTVTAEEAETGWEIELEGTGAAQVGRPFKLFLRARERDAVEDATIRVLVGEQSYPATRTGPGAYEVSLPALPPGTPELVIEASRPGEMPLSRRILVPVEYRGTIVAPQKVEGRAGQPLSIEAWLRDRLGEVVVEFPVPLVLVAGDRAVLMQPHPQRSGHYIADLILPAGTHRLVVGSLAGRGLYRQMITAEVRPAPPGERSGPTTGEEPHPLPAGVAPARLVADQIRVDGDLAEWAGDPAIRIGPESPLLTDPDLYGGADDFSAEVWVGWRPGTFYLAGRVRDDIVTFGDQWDSDRLNLVFDMGNDTTPLTYGTPSEPATSVESNRWAPDDYWILARVFADSDWRAGPVIRVGKDVFQEQEQLEFSARRTSAGYEFELALPAATLPAYGDGFAGKVIGFQLFFTDGDRESTITELMWHGRWGYDSGGIHWEMHNMGRLLFTGMPIP